MVLLWNTTGNIEVLEAFKPTPSYSMSIFVVDSVTKDNLLTKSLLNIPSTQTPLIQLIPSNFKFINKHVDIAIVDNTFYTYQDPLQLYLKYNDNQVPLPLYFSSKQKLNNLIMREASVSDIPFNNITIFFKNI